MKKSVNVLLFLAMLTFGCSYSTFFMEDGMEAYPATNPDEIELYSGDIDCNYEIIAAVASDVAGNGNKASARIRTEAAKIGADAIIFVKLTKISSIAQRTGVSGTAIRFTK